jgi:hypothetical protein
MFGRDEELERVRSALLATDSDMSVFRTWQKQYDKIKKQWQSVRERYAAASLTTGRVEEDAAQMEQMLTGTKPLDRSEFACILKELKRLQNSFDHEFLISREDHEFHSTYDAILRLGIKALDAPDQKLILQSEIENLLELLRENLSKDAPDPKKLCFFYQYGTDQELAGLSPADRLSRIDRMYEANFEKPMLQLLTTAIHKADQKSGQLWGRSDRRSQRELAAIQILIDTAGGEPQQRAKGLLELLMA